MGNPNQAQDEQVSVRPVFSTPIERIIYSRRPISELTKRYDTWQI